MNFKFLSLITFTLLSVQAYSAALEWGDLDLYNRYTLNREINLDDKIIFHAGDKFDMLDRFGGDAPVIYLQFHSVICKNPDLTSEMVILNPNPEDASRNRSIAVQLEEGCNIGIFVEPVDYYSNSLFDADN